MFLPVQREYQIYLVQKYHLDICSTQGHKRILGVLAFLVTREFWVSSLSWSSESWVSLLLLWCLLLLSVWRYAKDNGFTIVTKDSDFHEFSLVYGNPPKVIWLKCGNKPKWYVLGLLLNNRDQIEAFLNDNESACLEIY
jgi:hypothetical protein